MGTSEDPNEFLFYFDLLVQMNNLDRYPFTRLVVEKHLTKKEYLELFELLSYLDEELHSQKEEGLLHFHSLLLHFVGMLNSKLDPVETMKALKKEGLYPSLIDKLLTIHLNNNNIF